MSDIMGNSSPRTTTSDELNPQALMLLYKEAPKVYDKLMKERSHYRRLAWAEQIAQIVGNLSGLAALAILATISWHAFDRNAATQGAAIICTGAVSIVAVFVTGRVAASRAQTKRNRDSGS